MGGNSYRRRHFSDSELIELMAKINGLASLFDHRVYASERLWRAHISRHLDTDSSIRFYFMIEKTKGDLPNCRFCLKELNIESFKYSSKTSKRFRKYCPECTQKQVWKLSESYAPGALTERGNKISKKKFEFYQTVKGKINSRNYWKEKFRCFEKVFSN